MRGDLPQAALNLLASLPVRVHKAPEPVPLYAVGDLTREEYLRAWTVENRPRRNAYQAAKQREYRKRRATA